MRSLIDVAIIGAGPNGLSLAAHLRALGIDFRIFGRPMELWRDHMPPGMRLKSDGNSSDLSDPLGALPLKAFCGAAGYDFDESLKPIPVETFTAYGMAFQQRFVPELEPKMLVAMDRSADGFALRFDDQELVMARRVVLAVGIAPFAFLPDFLAGLPAELVSHSSSYGPLDRFKGQEVVVMGAGASAIDLAGLLKDAGADVKLMTRRPTVEFHAAPGPRSLLNRLRAPDSGMGAGWQLRIFADEPLVFHALPESIRLHKARTMLGPSAGWFMKDSIVGRVPILTGHVPVRAAVEGGKLRIEATTLDGRQQTVVTPHLIAATGYRIDLRRLGFLAPGLAAGLKTVGHAPALSRNFESSVPGLHFVGPVAVNSFGPLVRFVLGTRYQSRRLSQHLTAGLAESRRGENLAPVAAARS